jgi:hypothetical protein
LLILQCKQIIECKNLFFNNYQHLSSEYVKDIIIDFRNTVTIIDTDTANTSNKPQTQIINNNNNNDDDDDEAIANKFLSSNHAIFLYLNIGIYCHNRCYNQRKMYSIYHNLILIFYSQYLDKLAFYILLLLF